MSSNVIEGEKAREYESHFHKDNRQKLFDDFLLKNIRPGKNIRICELCCGPGNNIELLKGRFGEFSAIDLSKEMIEICKNKFGREKNVKLKLASATDTGLKSGHFDYVLIRMGIHHIKEKEAVVSEAYRLLRKGGKFLIIDKFYLSKPEMYFKGLIKMISHGNTSAFGEYIVSKKEYESLFSKRFVVTKREYIAPSFQHIGQSFMYVLEKPA